MEDLREAYFLGKSSNNELTPEILKQKGWSNQKIVKVINSLVEKRLCIYDKNKITGSVRVKVRDEKTAHEIRGLSKSDYAVFCSVEESGNKGIWTNDICRATGLVSHVVQKAVKTLSENKKLIKPLKSIYQKNRKMYILSNIEPAKEIVGGTFYEDGEFDEGLVERLREQILNVVKIGSESTLKDIANYMKTSGFGKDFNTDDLKLVLETLVLELQISTHVAPGSGEVVYTWSRPDDSEISSFVNIPCYRCPLMNECVRFEGCRVTPLNCKYFDFWLDYDTEFKN